MFLDLNASKLIIKLKKIVSDGELIISIPGVLLDSKIHSGMDDAFFVLVNGTEDNFDEVVSSEYSALSISFEEDTKRL